MDQLKISFFEEHRFDDVSIRLLQGITGLYLIYLKDLLIPYPFQSSRLIYIGMSESKQNSIGNRLRGHKTGQSGNLAIANYANKYDVRFTYHSLEFLKTIGTENVLELESFFLTDFFKHYGAYPICNNQSGVSFPESSLSNERIDVDWHYFQ